MMKFFFVAAGLYAVSTIDFIPIKTFLQERLSMQTTYMYIYFKDFALLTKSTKRVSSLTKSTFITTHVLRLSRTV